MVPPNSLTSFEVIDSELSSLASRGVREDYRYPNRLQQQVDPVGVDVTAGSHVYERGEVRVPHGSGFP